MQNNFFGVCLFRKTNSLNSLQINSYIQQEVLDK